MQNSTRLRRVFHCFFLILSGFSPCWLWAEESTTLPEVVVTANRLESSLDQVPNSITVITAKDFEQKQANTVQDALIGVPGLDIVQTGPPGESSSIFLRGANPQHTLVLMDGVPLNDPVGAAGDYSYLDQISLDDVKRIEVVRGPGSTLFGSNAMGGIVNIITRGGEGKLGGSILSEGGSRLTFREAVAVQGGGADGNFAFDASHYRTAGFPVLDKTLGGTLDNSDENNTISVRLGSAIEPNFQQNVLVRYNQSNTSLDAYNSSFVLADHPDYYALQKQFMMSSRSDWKLFDGDWEQQLNISFVEDNRTYTGVSNPTNTYFENGNFDGQTAQVLWQNNFRIVKGETLVLGLQGQQQWAAEADSNGYSDASYLNLSDAVTATAHTGTGFAESQTSIDDRLFLNIGGRWETHSQYGDHATFQTGLAYLIPELETKLKANYGTAFLAPSLYQLYNPNYGNKALNPETSIGFDLGFEQPLGKDFLTVGAMYFDNDFTDLINFYFDPVTFLAYYVNVGKARTYGVESFFNFKGLEHLEVKGTYTYTNAMNTATNTELLRRPQNKVGLDTDYQLGTADFGATASYVGSRLDTDFSFSQTILPPYFLVGLRASCQISPRVRIFARVENLFDQAYEEAFGYGTPGLSVYGGTKVSF